MFVNLDSEQLYLLNKLADDAEFTFDEILDICINVGIHRLLDVNNQVKTFAQRFIRYASELESQNDYE